MRGQTYVILAIIVFIIIALFAVINVEPVEVNYLFWTGESPLILIILFSVLMGGLITAAVSTVKMFQLQREVKRLQDENEKMTAVLEENNLLIEENTEKNESNKEKY